ncbi:MAG: hypothetical protein ABSD67_11295 [Terracidiphilus sp.]|jgi:hypothetical protein
MTRRRAILLFTLVSAISGLTGCGFPNLPAFTLPTQPTQPFSILFVESPPASMAVNASTTVYAAVENSPSTNQVNYSVICASANACGVLSPSDEAGAIVYTAPSAIPSGASVTITATAAADATKSVSAVVTITPPIAISVSFQSPLPASLQVNAAVSWIAVIKNDTSANPQVKWTVDCGGTSCGSFNPAVTSNYFATGYTAPASIPPDNTVTVTATSVTDPTKSASATITIVAQGPTLANGTYVFQISGPAGSAANFTTGVIVAANGTITGGEQDSIAYNTDDNGNLYPYSYLSGEITGGSYSATSDGNIQISIISGDGGGETLNGVLASGQRGFVAQLYGSLGSGTLDLQTSASAPTGGYAISLYGGDQYGGESWLGGILNIDSAGGISGAGSELDLIDAGYSGLPSGEETLGASTVTAPDKFGRVQFLLNTGASSALPVQDLVGYIEDATHMRLISSVYNNQENYQGVMGGMALGQGASTGHFSNSSLAGTSYVFGASTLTQYSQYQLAGVVIANADGTLGGMVNWNNLTEKTAQSPLPVNGSWTIDSTGRATLSNVTQASTSTEPFTDGMHLYLTGDGNALLLSSEGANPFAGQAFLQQTAAFTAASFNGTYGLNASLANNGATSPNSVAVGSITSVADNGADLLAGFADGGSGGADFAISGSFTPGSNGVFTGTLTGLDAASRTTTDNFTLYLVDNTRAVAIETDGSQLILGYLQLQQ